MENTYITFFILATFLIIVLAAERLTAGRRDRVTAAPRLSDRTLLAGYAVAFLLALALTFVTGLYLPVPLVLAVGLIGLVFRQSAEEVRTSGTTPFLDALRSVSGQQWLNAATIALAILFLTFSTFGSNLRGIWDAAQPLFNSGAACPGNPFPLNPCRKDIVGGLFYWLSQHRVHRGGQPWFYYSLLFGLYEQIAVAFGLGGILWFLRRPTTFTVFLTYWAILAFGIYSWAGEKFPWLMIHPLVPFILLAALFATEIVRAATPLRYLALAILAVLLLLEVHSTYEVNYVYGADPVEMMVYVQSAPDTVTVSNRIEAISSKVTNGPNLQVAIDTDDTWPFAWYLRTMPNIAYPAYQQLIQQPYSSYPVILVDESHQAALLPALKGNYTGHRYILRWWFPEDYKALTWASFARDLVNPGYWRVVWDWLTVRRPFGPKGAVHFYLYVKKGLVTPF